MFYILGFLVIGILISIIPFSSTSKKERNQQINYQTKLNKLIDDNVIEKTRTFINNEFTKAIILDEVNKKIHLFNVSNNTCRNYNFDDIIQSEIIVDNSTLIKSQKGKQILGAVVGNAIAGVPGMIVGALLPDQIVSEKVKNINLKLTLNDIDNPIYQISFLNSNKALSKDFAQVKNAITSIDKWHGIFDVIIKQQNKVI